MRIEIEIIKARARLQKTPDATKRAFWLKHILFLKELKNEKANRENS